MNEDFSKNFSKLDIWLLFIDLIHSMIFISCEWVYIHYGSLHFGDDRDI